MSETIMITRLHLTKYQEAYFHITIYVLIAILPTIIAELKGYPRFSDITPMEWVCLFLTCMLQTCNTIKAFLDKTLTKIKEEQKPNPSTP